MHFRKGLRLRVVYRATKEQTPDMGWNATPHGRDCFHTVPIFSLVRNAFMKGNMEMRAHRIYRPTPSHLERRQEKFGTRMERVPTTLRDLLRARNAMTLMFLGHKNETFFRWYLRLIFDRAARRSRGEHVLKVISLSAPSAKSAVNEFL